MFNTKVQNVTDIEQINGAMILGELSHKEKGDSWLSVNQAGLPFRIFQIYPHEP